MNTKIILVPVGLALLCAGCVGNGPNTERGALGGALIGAIAGGAIGNNSGHGNGGQGALIGAAAGAIVGGSMGNEVDHRNGTIYGSEREATTQIEVESPPPPPPPPREREVVYERSESDAIWIEGHYEYDSRGYFWSPGHWETPPPRYHHYVAPHWERRGRTQIYIRGYWRG